MQRKYRIKEASWVKKYVKIEQNLLCIKEIKRFWKIYTVEKRRILLV